MIKPDVLAIAPPMSLSQPEPDPPPEAIVENNKLAAGLRDLARTQALWLNVVGDCMAPSLCSGQRIAVSYRRFYWPGDVVAFRAWDGRLLIHRVLGYRRRMGRMELITCADRATKTDAPIKLDQVIGKVVGVDPPSGLWPVSGARRFQATVRYCQLAWRQLKARLKP